MNVYGIRDTRTEHWEYLLNTSDPAAISQVAHIINAEGSKHALAQFPAEFEIWFIAKIDGGEAEDTDRVKIASCDSLIRERVRNGGTTGATAPESPAQPSRSPSGAFGAHPAPQGQDPARPVPGAPESGSRPGAGPSGGDSRADRR